MGEILPLKNSRILWGEKSRPKIAYCTQRPWIVATTVKANITMAGVIVSGGQKARIALARAVYADADSKYVFLKPNKC